MCVKLRANRELLVWSNVASFHSLEKYCGWQGNEYKATCSMCLCNTSYSLQFVYVENQNSRLTDTTNAEWTTYFTRNRQILPNIELTTSLWRCEGEAVEINSFNQSGQYIRWLLRDLRFTEMVASGHMAHLPKLEIRKTNLFQLRLEIETRFVRLCYILKFPSTYTTNRIVKAM